MSQSKYLPNKLIQCGLLATSIAATSGHAIASDDLRFNGFMSIGVGMMDTDDKTFDGSREFSLSNYTDRFDLKSGSLFALQVSKQVNDMIGVTGQLVAKGSNNFDMDASWAYVTFSPTDSDSIRAGRLRIPFFYYSDFLEVGYAYNWVRPPSDVYQRLPFSTLEGIDYTRQFEFGDVTGSAQVYYGRFQDTLPVNAAISIDADLQDFMGVMLNLAWEDFTFRTSYHQADLNADVSAILAAQGVPAPFIKDFTLDNRTSTFTEFAVAYDNGTNIAVFEYTALDHDTALYADDNAWLAMYGHRINDITLHATYSTEDNTLESGTVGAIQKNISTTAKSTSVIAGLRWDFAANTAFKFEVQNTKQENHDGKEISGNLFSVAVDVVF